MSTIYSGVVLNACRLLHSHNLHKPKTLSQVDQESFSFNGDVGPQTAAWTKVRMMHHLKD